MPLALQIELLSKAETDAIWKARGRAENFAEYLTFINAREIGDSFRIPVAKGENNAAAAREIRHNFTEAAKERTRDGNAAPVLLKWKTDKHTEQRVLKKGEPAVDVEVIDKITALLIATDSVKKRAPRAKKEETATPETPTTNGVSAEHQAEPATSANSAA